MKQLLLKDIAICRNTILFGFLLSFLPYICYGIYMINLAPRNTGELFSMLGEFAYGGAIYSAMLNCLAIGLLSASIVSTERRERTSEFLYYLPPTKVKILLSKFIVCMLFYLVLSCVFLGVIFWLVPWLTSGEVEPLGTDLFAFVLIAFAIFGCSWFGSCVFASPQVAALFGICVPFIVYLLVIQVANRIWPGLPDDLMQIVSTVTATTIGGVGLLLGSILFIRRIEP